MDCGLENRQWQYSVSQFWMAVCDHVKEYLCSQEVYTDLVLRKKAHLGVNEKNAAYIQMVHKRKYI